MMMESLSIDGTRQKSLRYFNVFRLLLASILLIFGRDLGLGGENERFFIGITLFYLVAVLALGFPDAARRLGENNVATLQFLIDIVVLTLISGVSGGFRSGTSLLLMVVLTAGGLAAGGRMVMFFAALAVLGALGESAIRLWLRGIPIDFAQVGTACIGFFGVAIIARLLALRARTNASLALKRGIELAQEQEINERIIRDMQDGVIVIGSDGKIRQANPQARALLAQKNIEGLTLAEINPALDVALPRPGRTIQFEHEGRSLRCRALVADSRFEAQGDTLLFLTDFERVQRELQQVKLAALGRLTASMAHEIRNPLTAVIQAAELLEDEERKPIQQRLLGIIGDNSKRINLMVRDILALGRRDQAAVESLLLAPFVEEVVDAHSLEGEEARAIYRILIPPAQTIAFDCTHLRQIVDNLLNNARRYCSGEAGSILIWSEGLPGERVALHVQDDGPGLSEKSIEHLFEPFFTTHSKGSGLGLYIARELAEANEAALEYRMSDGGAHFVLTGRVWA